MVASSKRKSRHSGVQTRHKSLNEGSFKRASQSKKLAPAVRAPEEGFIPGTKVWHRKDGTTVDFTGEIYFPWLLEDRAALEVLGKESLPSYEYYSPEYASREKERVFVAHLPTLRAKSRNLGVFAYQSTRYVEIGYAADHLTRSQMNKIDDEDIDDRTFNVGNGSVLRGGRVGSAGSLVNHSTESNAEFLVYNPQHFKGWKKMLGDAKAALAVKLSQPLEGLQQILVDYGAAANELMETFSKEDGVLIDLDQDTPFGSPHVHLDLNKERYGYQKKHIQDIHAAGKSIIQFYYPDIYENFSEGNIWVPTKNDNAFVLFVHPEKEKSMYLWKGMFEKKNIAQWDDKILRKNECRGRNAFWHVGKGELPQLLKRLPEDIVYKFLTDQHADNNDSVWHFWLRTQKYKTFLTAFDWMVEYSKKKREIERLDRRKNPPEENRKSFPLFYFYSLENNDGQDLIQSIYRTAELREILCDPVILKAAELFREALPSLADPKVELLSESALRDLENNAIIMLTDFAEERVIEEGTKALDEKKRKNAEDADLRIEPQFDEHFTELRLNSRYQEALAAYGAFRENGERNHEDNLCLSERGFFSHPSRVFSSPNKRHRTQTTEGGQDRLSRSMQKAIDDFDEAREARARFVKEELGRLERTMKSFGRTVAALDKKFEMERRGVKPTSRPLAKDKKTAKKRKRPPQPPGRSAAATQRSL